MKIDGHTRLTGILGHPVSHSLSPLMQNAAFEAMGENIVYVPLHVLPEDLPQAVDGLRATGFLGANVTIPHKVAVASLMDVLSDSSVRTGAVNTIVSCDGGLTGYNTDGIGFINALEELIQLDYHESPALIAGAGGAARSVAAALAEKQVPRIAIVNRTRSRGEELASLLEGGFPGVDTTVMTPDDDLAEVIFASKLLINATSIGMERDLKRTPFPVDGLTRKHVVCDIVYTMKETPLLAAAREKGATFMGGLPMLLHQGAAAARLWTGKQPPIKVMRNAIGS